MVPSPESIPSSLAPGPAHAFLEHMGREESALAAMLQSLREVRQALLENDLDSFSHALERQARRARDAERLQAVRPQILQELRDSFDTTAEPLTLKAVADALPVPEGEWLARCRDRLNEMAAEAHRLNGQNAVMVHQAVDLTRQVLAELIREGPGGEGYNAAGGRRDAVGRSIIELGG